jgi:hypothetical protein
LVTGIVATHSDASIAQQRLDHSGGDEKSDSDENSDNGGGGGDRPLDLDTRLQMLMKVKSANMPAFLMRSDSSEDEEQKAATLKAATVPPPPPVGGPLSRSPSPFLSRESYLASYQLTSQQEELERVNLALASLPPLHTLPPPHGGLPPLPNGGLFATGEGGVLAVSEKIGQGSGPESSTFRVQ